MSEATLSETGQRLDDTFYPERAEALRQELRNAEGAAVSALRDASGVQDEVVLTRLAGLGIRAETLAALTLIPIVEVAWADGKMASRERGAILAGAESSGIGVETPSHGMLAIWTEDPPAPDLFGAWRDFITALQAELEPAERDHLREKLVGQARAVAEAAGGFLGLGSVSKEERAVLDALEGSFSPGS